uniref:NADH dehydrogenase subunit 6 n=1 Tax=Aradus compar TaxID=1176475 RepID=A0A171LH90_9HEMI|nr:NADH dehydrogenase subunit 6 [Aradus compar]AFI54703.1 NADH dehydrogenase subunit 6 [Aradus compar]
MLMATTFMLTSIMPWMKHPLSMGAILLAETLIIAMMTGVYIKSYLYSYILVMTMLSGMLVLFMYMSSIAPNKKFKMSRVMMATATIIFLGSLALAPEMASTEVITEINTPSKGVQSLFNRDTSCITIMLVLYLLFTMIVVTNIVNVQEGPLRSKM